jgi:hypothetical protein
MGPGILPFNLAMLVGLVLFLNPKEIENFFHNKKSRLELYVKLHNRHKVQQNA